MIHGPVSLQYLTTPKESLTVVKIKIFESFYLKIEQGIPVPLKLGILYIRHTYIPLVVTLEKILYR